MKDRLSRFPSLFFSAGKKMDDLFSLLQQIAEEQRNSRQKSRPSKSDSLNRSSFGNNSGNSCKIVVVSWKNIWNL